MHVFENAIEPDLYGFSSDRDGNNLPPERGQWKYFKTIDMAASGDGDDLVGEVADPQVIPLKRPWYTPTVVEVTCPARQAA